MSSDSDDDFGPPPRRRRPRPPRLLVPTYSRARSPFSILQGVLGYFIAYCAASERMQRDEPDEWQEFEEEYLSEYFGFGLLRPSLLAVAAHRKLERLLRLAFHSIPRIEAGLDPISVPDRQVIGAKLRESLQRFAVLIGQTETNPEETDRVIAEMKATLGLIRHLPTNRGNPMAKGSQATEQPVQQAEGRATNPDGTSNKNASEESTWPADDGWDFRSGEVAFRRKVFPLSGVSFSLLKAFVDSRFAITPQALKQKGVINEDVPNDTIRGYVSRLRDELRAAFGWGKDYDPLPHVDRGKQLAWKLADELHTP